jgi:hypothetical protein
VLLYSPFHFPAVKEKKSGAFQFIRVSANSRFPKPVKCSVADPNPGSGAFWTPGSGMGKKSGMNSPEHISESLETISWVKILKFVDVDPGSEMEKN